MWQSADDDDDGEAVWLSKVSAGGVIGVGCMVWYGMVWLGVIWVGCMVWYGMVWYGMVCRSYMGGLCLPASSDHLNILPLPPACARAKFQTFFILSKTGNVSKTPISSPFATFPICI